MPFKFGVWVCGGVNFHVSGRRKRGWEVFRELVHPSTDSEIQVELGVDSLDVGTVGNVREGLGEENSRYTGSVEPRDSSHGKF